MTRSRSPETLRSARWFDGDTLRAFGHRSRMMQMGYGTQDWAGRPIIAIINTWSDLNPCHAHFKQRVADIRRGVLQAGGLPMGLPALSLSESFPARRSSQNFHASEPDPSTLPFQLPRSIGPAGA